RQGLLRLPDYRPLEEPLIAAAVDRGRPVALIGEAQAFFYRTPLAEKPSLLYRSVFDVTAPADQPAADQWLGRSVEELRAAGYTVVVNAAELERLGGTYRHLSKQVTPTPSGVIVLPPK
ncbi:MAG TPA: hypothetical protein VGB55_01075, partial [Tepidisphaeraceae bacterium]